MGLSSESRLIKREREEPVGRLGKWDRLELAARASRGREQVGSRQGGYCTPTLAELSEYPTEKGQDNPCVSHYQYLAMMQQPTCRWRSISSRPTDCQTATHIYPQKTPTGTLDNNQLPVLTQHAYPSPGPMWFYAECTHLFQAARRYQKDVQGGRVWYVAELRLRIPRWAVPLPCRARPSRSKSKAGAKTCILER